MGTGDYHFLRRWLEHRPPLPLSLRQVDPLIRQRIELLQQLIAERRRVDHDTGREVFLVESGKHVMDQIRLRLVNVEDEERRRLVQREASAKTVLWTSIATAIVGGIASIGILILANWLIRWDTVNRRRGEINLRQSEERFRLVAETLPQIVWVTAPDGFHEFFNTRWYDYTGMTSAKSLGFGWTIPLHPDDRTRSELRWKTSLDSGEPFEVEYRLRRFDDVYRWFLARAVPQHDAAGRIVKWFGTLTDIDDQRRLKEELEKQVHARTAELEGVVSDLNAEVAERERSAELLRLSSAELARSNRELETFAYAASHDMQEPLRKIQAFGDRLSAKFADRLGPDGVDIIDRMQSSSRRMRQLIEDLLGFSRVATRPRVYASVDLNETLRDVLADLEEAVESSGGRVDVGPLPTIRADASQMRQLFQNLLANSLKFRRPGVLPVVTIRAKMLTRSPDDSATGPDHPAVRIEVADNGPGIDPSGTPKG
jgi:PAS domain S-box-containing protein